MFLFIIKCVALKPSSQTDNGRINEIECGKNCLHSQGIVSFIKKTSIGIYGMNSYFESLSLAQMT
jgi:hypothetical protein